ncbi:MAG: 30S ribosome-binding factor RbfA [Desulfobacterales bacterium]|jgi:ribosome-binding factor A|nr:30S ribosome-binding factor RbfA [Desulfobacterales bacterium]
MEGKRSDRVADSIRKEISEMLVKTIKDPRIGFITITRVTVSEDCRLAKVYYSVVGTPEQKRQSMEGLNSAKGYIRRELGHRMKLKYTPELVFQFDPSIEYAIHMGELIHHLQEERAEIEGRDED